MANGANAASIPDGPGRSVYHRLVDGAASATLVWLWVNTASGNVSFALYGTKNSGRSSQPDTRKSTTGAILCPAAGYVEVAVTPAAAIVNGDWVGISADNTTATFLVGITTPQNVGLAKGASHFEITHPAPATANAPSPAPGRIFVMGAA